MDIIYLQELIYQQKAENAAAEFASADQNPAVEKIPRAFRSNPFSIF